MSASEEAKRTIMNRGVERQHATAKVSIRPT
jgi:hypothetical protein